MSMAGNVSETPKNWAARLQRFARPPAASREIETCELCSAPLRRDHAHLVVPAENRMICACEGCDLLLGDREDRKFVRVPTETQILQDFRLSDAEWDALGIPIGLAFFFHSTPQDRTIALYPGPAGPTESLLTLDAWSGIVQRNPVLRALEPDVEALLVNRVNSAAEYYRVPIDRCYGLVGLIRMHWKGVSGGEDAWSAISDFFAQLRGEPVKQPGDFIHD